MTPRRMYIVFPCSRRANSALVRDKKKEQIIHPSRAHKNCKATISLRCKRMERHESILDGDIKMY